MVMNLTAKGNGRLINLPLSEALMASRGSTELGPAEMKGSWFIFDSHRARGLVPLARPLLSRQPSTRPQEPPNYHLGFRWCATLDPR
jgi:hypothetical protein